MINKLRVRANSESGFTLVELLVVMLILGLLAAIAIPAFFNQREKAKDSDAKAAAKTMQTAMETYSTDNDGSYLLADLMKLEAIEPAINDAPKGTAGATDPTVTGLGDKTFIVTVTSETGNTFSIEREASGATVLECTAAGTAGCPGSGGGVGTWSG